MQTVPVSHSVSVVYVYYIYHVVIYKICDAYIVRSFARSIAPCVWPCEQFRAVRRVVRMRASDLASVTGWIACAFAVSESPTMLTILRCEVICKVNRGVDREVGCKSTGVSSGRHALNMHPACDCCEVLRTCHLLGGRSLCGLRCSFRGGLQYHSAPPPPPPLRGVIRKPISGHSQGDSHPTM